jgi:hypothetical protein
LLPEQLIDVFSALVTLQGRRCGAFRSDPKGLVASSEFCDQRPLVCLGLVIDSEWIDDAPQLAKTDKQAK